jgi:hypothetical protein
MITSGLQIFLTYLRLPPLGTPFEQAKSGDIHTPGMALYNFNRAQSPTEQASSPGIVRSVKGTQT